jgi:hypothetical protein
MGGGACGEQRKLDIPGPRQLPILCNILDTVRHKHRINDYVLEQALKTPKGCFHFVVPFGGDTNVLVSDPPSVEYILKTHFEVRRGDVLLLHSLVLLHVKACL